LNLDEAVLRMYGDDVKKMGSLTHSLLLAPRLVERGVRTVQILHRGWDQHGNLPRDLAARCLDTAGRSTIMQAENSVGSNTFRGIIRPLAKCL
jgi:hypothetical protein